MGQSSASQSSASQIAYQQELVLEALSYAKVLAKKFYHKRKECGFSLEEFESAAFFGLCDSAQRYDPRSSVSFRGFAYLRIQGEMNDLLRTNGLITRRQARALSGIIGGESGREAIGRLLASLNIELHRFKDLIEESGIRLYFNTKNQFVDISYATEFSVEDRLLNQLLCAHLKDLMLLLPEKERKVIHLKYFEDLTFEEMGAYFDGATRSWLCRIHARGIAKLRALIFQTTSSVTEGRKAA
jgi:RNA polymerase sigma factor (sigma-70 family)